MSKTINLSAFVVRNVNGSVDQEGTLVKFAEFLSEWEAEVGEAQAKIAVAVGAIFDEYRGACLNKAYLQGEVARRLGATPANWKEVSDGVDAYIKGNNQGEVFEDGTQERPESIFVTKPGKSGGTYRRADFKPKA